MIFKQIIPLHSYAVHPNWDSFNTPGGLSLGEEMYERDENMPTYLYPVSGRVVAVPDNTPVLPGDEIYFTWNGVSFVKCLSPIEEENIFMLNDAAFAYKRDEELHTLGEFLLLKPIVNDPRLSDGGLIVSGYSVGGPSENPRTDRDINDLPFIGIIAVIPAGVTSVKVGDKVCIMITSDVRVQIDDQRYYRTRLSEVLFRYAN